MPHAAMRGTCESDTRCSGDWNGLDNVVSALRLECLLQCGRASHDKVHEHRSVCAPLVQAPFAHRQRRAWCYCGHKTCCATTSNHPRPVAAPCAECSSGAGITVQERIAMIVQSMSLEVSTQTVFKSASLQSCRHSQAAPRFHAASGRVFGATRPGVQLAAATQHPSVRFPGRAPSAARTRHVRVHPSLHA